MHYFKTMEGYPVLLATRARTPRFFSEDTLTHGNRKTPWVYLTQNPRGRWQVLVPDPDERGNVLCVAGGKTVAQVLPEFVSQAFSLGILKRGGVRGHPEATRRVLFSLGTFARYAS